MSAALDQHQMCTERRGGGNPVAASRARHAIGAHQFQSVTSKSADTRPGKVATDLGHLHSRMRGGRFSHRRQVGSFPPPGVRPVASTSRGWCVALNDLATFRARIAAGLTPEQAVALDDRPLAGAQAFRIEAALSQPEIEPPHQFRVLSFDASDEKQRSEGFDGTVLYLSGEFPKASGDHQHEFR